MNTYSIVLKKLIHLTNIKLSTLSEIVGYDTSYISKWCNKDKLPTVKSASTVNKALAAAFSDEIIRQDELAVFSQTFELTSSVNTTQIESVIFSLLKESYNYSCSINKDAETSASTPAYHLLLWPSEIENFILKELPNMINQLNSECSILCTMDINRLMAEMHWHFDLSEHPVIPIYVKAGMSMNQNSIKEYIPRLYYMMNHYHYINFDFYDNQSMELMNMIVIKDCMAIQCSLDKDYHLNMLTVIRDVSQVNEIYKKISAEFTPNKLLIHSTDSDELFYNGYRTEFYSHDTFQLMPTKGFEFLLPPDTLEKLVDSSKQQELGDNIGQLIAYLGIAWEEIFEKGKLDFYIPKSSIMQYVTDGVIYFTDVVYKMSIEERRNHIQHVLKLIQNNPNICFYILNDEFLTSSDHPFRLSIYNNKKKLFLKNIERYNYPYGPYFYMIQNDELIHEVTQYIETLKESPYCRVYHAEDVLQFYEKYGTMIDRMLSVS